MVRDFYIFFSLLHLKNVTLMFAGVRTTLILHFQFSDVYLCLLYHVLLHFLCPSAKVLDLMKAEVSQY